MADFISDNWPSKGAPFNEFQYFTNVSSTPSWQAKTIRKITLPNSIKIISDYSFMKSMLGEINNTSQVTEVGYRAFNSSSTLKSIDLGAVTTIGGEAFKGNTKLESVGNTKNLADIGEAAFSGCSSLKEMDLSNLKTIEKGAFNGCGALTEINSSLASLSEIPEYLFCGCMELNASITLPAVIGASAFGNCRKIVFDLSDFEKVESIGSMAFLQCWKITGDLRLKKIAALGNQAFVNAKITSVDMTGAPLEKIDDYCFKNCASLKVVTISENTTTIGPGVFYGCENITEYHILSKTPAKVDSSSFAGAGSYIIYVPKGCSTVYKDKWAVYADHIREEE